MKTSLITLILLFLWQTANGQWFLCPDCLTCISDFIDANKAGANDEILKSILERYCPIVWMNTTSTCKGAIDSYFPTIKYVVEHNPNLSPNVACSQIFQAYDVCYFPNPHDNWSIELSPGGPEHLEPKRSLQIPLRGRPLKILHLTDFHYDPQYRTGGVVNCVDIVCCRQINESVPLSDRAGKWGNYNYCDTPLRTIKNAIEHIASTHEKFDLIYVTGDFGDHALWEVTWPYNFHAMSTIMKLITNAFPDTPIFPLVGNHDPNPTDVYSPSYIHGQNISSDPLYKFMANNWYWLPDDAKQTILDGGYYTVLVQPKFRIIALNNNVCLGNNWWILLNESVLAEPLQWLQNLLYQAEQNGELVHILTHVPGSHSSCYRKWAQQFNRIVERYRNIIQGQFVGHTHRDQFNIFFAESNPFIPVNVMWNGGSINTMLSVNPNYRIYSVNPQSYEVIDYETWIFNLTKANAHEKNRPEWFLEYRFKEAFQVADLSPASLFTLAKRMAVDNDLLTKYWRYYLKQGDLGLEEGCDEKCLQKLLCDIVTTEYKSNEPRCPYLSELNQSRNQLIEHPIVNGNDPLLTNVYKFLLQIFDRTVMTLKAVLTHLMY